MQITVTLAVTLDKELIYPEYDRTFHILVERFLEDPTTQRDEQGN